MSLGLVFSAPFYTGTETPADARWDVALDGHGYMVDTEQMDRFGRQSVEMIRQQADSADRPAESSLNPAGPWRRAPESWHHGAGQEWFDKPDSDPNRFHTSKGVDPWDRYGLTLLPDTTLLEAQAEANLHLAVANGRLYMAAGTAVRATGQGGVAFGDCTGEPATQVTALASDGVTLYAAFGPNGIYTTTGTTLAQFVTGRVDLVRYVKGRLIACSGGTVHNPTQAGPLNTDSTVFTHPVPSWQWTDAAEGPGHIYLAGFAGDKSAIYKTEIRPDGTELDVPVHAAPLPDGELALSLTGYQWYVVIGTTKGVRFAVPDNDGYLNIGALIPTGAPVLCGEGQDRFVWYGLGNYDDTSTGLGRLDLSQFTQALTPAYASDLMAADQGQVVSVATYLDKRVFTVATGGCYMQADTKVTTGYVTSGRITYGLPDLKTALDVAVRHDPLTSGSSVALALAVDGGEARGVGTSSTVETSESADEAFALNEARATFFELTVTLTGEAVLRRITLQIDPHADRTTIISVPLLLFDTADAGPVPVPVDVAAERRYLIDLYESGRAFTYREDGIDYRVKLDDYTWRPDKRSERKHAWQGTFIARLKEL